MIYLSCTSSAVEAASPSKNCLGKFD